MPTFVKPTPTALADFTIHLRVNEQRPAAPVATLSFSATLLDVWREQQRSAHSTRLHATSGDLSPFLTPAQVTAFTNAALNLYAKAKLELLT
jgi:hypothetical protein